MHTDTNTNNETTPQKGSYLYTAPEGYERKQKLQTILSISAHELKKIIDNNDIPHVDVLHARSGKRFVDRKIQDYYEIAAIRAILQKNKTVCEITVKIDGKDYPISPELQTQIEALILDNIKYNKLYAAIDKALEKQDELPFGGGFADNKIVCYLKDYSPLKDILPPGKTKSEVHSVWNRIRAIFGALNIKILDQNGKKLYHVPSTCYILKVKGIPFRDGLCANNKKVKYLWMRDILSYPSGSENYWKAVKILTKHCKKKPKEKGEGKSKIGCQLYHVKTAKRLLKKHGLEYNPNL